MGFCFMGCFDATYNYKLLEKLISNHSMFELSILFFFELCNFDSHGCHFDFLRGLFLYIYFVFFGASFLNKKRACYFMLYKIIP